MFHPVSRSSWIMRKAGTSIFLSWRLLQIKGTELLSLGACKKVVEELQQKLLCSGKTEERHSKSVRVVFLFVYDALCPI